ncbi:tRNA pseudouridine(55) synthase TruB [Buchnera aphidicola]|uniref:tRNA pseudouridine(55) synthase TruB n=1 Tax=Buchnera aphidicola TaxID=9 RepID=UPI001650F225|nr:tRNA pseudouridine(55) synthase TruB [Buchnera aphidicola]
MKYNHIKRNVNGILLLDKPVGLTSNAALQQVKKIFNAKKAGHTGSLDPLASGILPICLGLATKLSRYLLESNKTYSVIMKLGEITSTLDSEGVLLKTCIVHKNVFKNITNVVQKFLGESYQIPPLYSAVKYQGISLYKYARKNIIPPRTLRKIFIKKISVVSIYKNYVKIIVTCSKGTYIRTLIDDIGNILGCGAHVVYLRRIKLFIYELYHTISLQKLNQIQKKHNSYESSYYNHLDLFLLPMDHPISDFQYYCLDTKEIYMFKNGSKINIKQNILTGLIRVLRKNDKKFIGLGIIQEDHFLYPKKIFI